MKRLNESMPSVARKEGLKRKESYEQMPSNLVGFPPSALSLFPLHISSETFVGWLQGWK